MKNLFSSSFVALLVFVWLGSNGCSSARSPIVIIPGIMGSQVEALLHNMTGNHSYCPNNRDWFRIWFSVTDDIPVLENCFLQYAKMEYDPVSGEYSNADGVTTRIPGFANTSTVEVLDPNVPYITDYFKKFVEHFVNLGYSRGVDITAAPFDWRLGPDQLEEDGYFKQLQSLIETTFDQSGGQQVVMVVHSLGSLVSHYFLTEIVSEEWKDMYIGQYITLAAVWAGAVKVLHGAVSGDTDGMFPFMSDKKIKMDERSFPSEYWLVPRTVKGVWTKNQTLIQTPYQNYSAYDLGSLMVDLQIQYLSSMYNGVMSSVGEELAPPNVTTLCMYSKGVPTPDSYIYDEDFPNGDYKKELLGDGDGTVNLNSLRACQNWIGAQSHPVEYQELDQVKHMNIVWDKGVLDTIEHAVLG